MQTNGVELMILRIDKPKLGSFQFLSPRLQVTAYISNKKYSLPSYNTESPKYYSPQYTPISN